MPEQTIPAEAEFTLLKKQLKGFRTRSSVRYRCALATLGWVAFPENEEKVEAWIYNLSEGGIGINLGRSLEVGASLIIKLRVRKDLISMPSRVIHSTREADGSFRIGCQFEQRLTPDVIDDLL